MLRPLTGAYPVRTSAVSVVLVIAFPASRVLRPGASNRPPNTVRQRRFKALGSRVRQGRTRTGVRHARMADATLTRLRWDQAPSDDDRTRLVAARRQIRAPERKRVLS